MTAISATSVCTGDQMVVSDDIEIKGVFNAYRTLKGFRIDFMDGSYLELSPMDMVFVLN
jgi:hypothetical protein